MANSYDSTTTLAENKVLILYTLHKIDKQLSESGLFKIVSSINNINYFYFKQFLTELEETKLVETYTEDKEQLIKLTSKGVNYLSLTQDMLPGIIKLKADNIFKKELYSIQEETSVIAEFIPKGENDYTIKCKIVENNETIFEVKTFVGSREIAKQIVDNWNENASKIYPNILAILTEK